MIKRAVLTMILLITVLSASVWADTDAEIKNLKTKIESQEGIIQQQQAMIEQLLNRVTKIEAKANIAPVTKPNSQQASTTRVDLQEEELSSFSESRSDESANVLNRPWYKNIRIDGFGAAGFAATGGKAARQHGGFVLHEATINVDAQVWEDVHYFHEIQTVRLGDESNKFVRTQEVYVHLKDVFKTLFEREGMDVGVKLGRVDIPFGEDYLTQDVFDNPLVTFSAAYPYGVDEGLLVYGKAKGVNWIWSVMDGTDSRAIEDDKDKFFSLKLYGNPTEKSYVSASFLRNGNAAKSAWELGGSHFEAVGSGGRTSSLGSSSSSKVDSHSFEVDFKYDFGFDRYVKAQYGYISIDDKMSTFDRDIQYFQVEPKWNLGERFDHKWYLVGRFSAVGTFDDVEGYSFDGKPFANGSSTFGYDTKALYRYALGLGFLPNPRTLIKIEYSIDDYRLIQSATQNGGTDGREFLGVIAAVKF